MKSRIPRLADVIEKADPMMAEGRVRASVGLSLRATLPGVRVGELVEIERQGRSELLAEVIGFIDDDVLLMPLGASEGLGPDDVVRKASRALSVTCSDQMLGRILDGLGQPIDERGPLEGVDQPILRKPPDPLTRPRIDAPLTLGIRSIDGLLTVGKGQRMGIFAGSGVGKSTLLGQIARQANADVFVACLIGERGREVREFLDDCLGSEGMKRGVVVCATSDAPALVRLKSAYVATSIAEFFRDQGRDVVLLMDSLTRFARAGREIGLSAGEPPARRGYPPSAFARLPGLLERAGLSPEGSITAFYTVLVEGGDMDEPVADEVRGILDGHIVLSRSIAERGLFPAVDPLQSLSRLMDAVTDAEHARLARSVRGHLAAYEAKRDLISLGAYQTGSDPGVDRAIARIDLIESFLRQAKDERADFDGTRKRLQALA